MVEEGGGTIISTRAGHHVLLREDIERAGNRLMSYEGGAHSQIGLVRSDTNAPFH